MLNEIILQGRLTATPELKHTNNDKAVTSFTLAVDRDFQTGDEKQVDFISCVAWGKTAEFVSNYFEKGKQIILRGSLQVRKYQTQNGENRYATEVIADKVYFAGDKQKTSQGENLSENTGDFVEVADYGDLPF